MNHGFFKNGHHLCISAVPDPKHWVSSIQHGTLVLCQPTQPKKKNERFLPISRHLCLAVCCLECQYFQCFSWSSLHFSSPNTTITTLWKYTVINSCISIMIFLCGDLFLVLGSCFYSPWLWWWAAAGLCCRPPWGWWDKTGLCSGTSWSRRPSSVAGTWTPLGCTQNYSCNTWKKKMKHPNTVSESWPKITQKNLGVCGLLSFTPRRGVRCLPCDRSEWGYSVVLCEKLNGGGKPTAGRRQSYSPRHGVKLWVLVRRHGGHA